MEAYWALAMGRDAEAEGLLREIVSRHPDDLEAGVNLTVLDLRYGRLEAARKRTDYLLGVYPEEPKVQELLSYLR